MVRENRRGVVLVMGVFLIFILFGVFSYIYETGRLTIAKIKAQNAADAAAAAGQIVYSNMRNNASTNYALMEIYEDMAKNAALWQYAKFMVALKRAYHQKDWNARSSERKLNEDELIHIHHAFHVQDACVTRYFASYESKVFKFRGIYSPERLKKYIKEVWIKPVINYNLYYVPDEYDAMGKPILWGNLWEPVTNPIVIRSMGGKYPFITPWRSGLSEAFVDVTNRNGYVPVNYDAETGLDKLGRFFVAVKVHLSHTPFERFLTMDWLNQWNFSLNNIFMDYVFATSAAQPKVFGDNEIYIYNVTHLPHFMLSLPFTGFSENDRYFGHPIWPDVDFGVLQPSSKFEWYWPTITRVFEDESNNPHH